jgi:GAF domain-containing protein
MARKIQSVGDFRSNLMDRLAKIRGAIHCDSITLHLYDSEHEQLYLPIAINLLDDHAFYRSVPSMDRVAGKVVHARSPIIADLAENHPDMTGPFTYREKIKSAAGFPVKRETSEEILGVIFLSYRSPHKFTEDETIKMQAWASEIAAFIEQTFKGKEGKNLRLALLRDAGQRRKVVRLQDILGRLREVLRNVDVALWLPQKGEQKLGLSARAGVAFNLFDTVEIDTSADSKNMIGEVFIHGKESAIVNYAEYAPKVFGVEAQTPWEKMQFFPIRSEYHALGVLSLFRRDPFEFTNQDKDAITAFTNLLAVTIENEDRIITLNALHDLGVRLTLSQNLKDVLNDVVRNACQIISADVATLHLFDPVSQQFLELDQAAVYPETARKYMERPRSDGGLTREILSKRRIYIEDIDKDPGLSTSTFIKKIGIKAYVGTPLVINGDALGVFYVSFKHPRRFSPDELSLIQIMANYASTAVHRTKLAEQQVAVTEIARDIVSNLEIDKILQTILERTLELLHCTEGSIALYDPEENELEFRYAIGKNLLRRIKPGKGLVGAAASTQKPVRIGDVTKDKRYVPIVPSTQSELDVPLLIGEDLVGVLNIESSQLNAFSAEDENLAMTLASQAAIAIANARLFGEAERRAEALKSLHDVASELISIVNTPDGLDVILKKIALNAQKVLGAELIDIYQYLKESDQFVLPPVRVGDRYEPDVVKERIYKDDVLYTIIEGGVPRFVQDAQSSQSGLRRGFSVERANIPRERFVVREKIKSSASIPMLVDHEVVGVLFVNYRSPQTYPPQQKELIGLFSNQAAIAIRNNRLYSRLQKSNQELDALQSLIGKLTIETNLDKLLQEFLQAIHGVLGFEYAVVALVNQADNTIESRHGIWHGEVDTFPDWIQMSKYPLDHPDIQADIVRKGQAEVISEWDERFNKEIWDKFNHERLVRIFMPIKIQDEVIGVVEAGYDKKRKNFISKDEQQSLQAFVDQAALAIQRTGQFQEIERNLEERLQDIRALQDITEEMHHGDLKAVLGLIAERAVAITNATHGGVWLVNKNRTALEFGGAASIADPGNRPPNIPLDPGSEVSFSKLVVLNKKSYRSGNVHIDPNYKSWYSDTVSELTVPILYQDRVIGTINVESSKEDSFTEEHQELLEAMAGQAAVAIQNARLIQRMDLVDSIGRELTSGIRLHEDQILDLIYRRASELMDTGNMYIALYDDEMDNIHFPLMYVGGNKKEQPARKFGNGGFGKTEWIIRNKETILHATKAEADAWYAQPGHQEFSGDPLAAWIGVPMQVGERVLGVIATYHPTLEYLYGQDELDVLKAMAGQAAIAIDNARLYYDVNQSLAEANDDLEALVTFGQEVTARINLTEKEILEKIYQHASKLMDTGNMYIALYDDSSQTISFPLMYVDGMKREQPPRKFGETGLGKTERIIMTREPIFHATKAEATAWYAQPGHQNFSPNILPSWIGAPIQIGERILGVIATFHPEKENLYSDKDLRILQGIARVAAITLENMRLYREARSEVVATKQLSTLGTAIAALQHRINNSFNIIIPNVSRLKLRVDLNDPTIVEILDIIERNARYTSEIIARIQEPLKEVEISDININAILGAIVLKKRDSWKSHVTSPLVTLSFNADERIPIVRGLSGQIAEIFENLMDNGYKAMPKGGEIEVVSELNDGNIMVRVKDCGNGIPPEIQERLFVKPVPSRNPGGGAGLGLWLSRLMLQSIGGDIGIESSNSAGTVMLVTIPVDQDRKES